MSPYREGSFTTYIESQMKAFNQTFSHRLDHSCDSMVRKEKMISKVLVLRDGTFNRVEYAQLFMMYLDLLHVKH